MSAARLATFTVGGRTRYGAVTGKGFNLIVAFERGEAGGRAVAESTFHHFCDYNWDPRSGCPSFVSERPSDRIVIDPRGRWSTERYVRNLAMWLAR